MRENNYLVFIDTDNNAIGRPHKVETLKEIDTMLESPPEGTCGHSLSTRERLLSSGLRIDIEDFNGD